MENRYHYGNEADQYAFFQIPKILFTDPVLSRISSEAKVLYGMMLDRLNLSQRNGWIDENGRVFIYFTLDEIHDQLGIYRQKTAKLLRELDDVHLIERKHQGLGKPNVRSAFSKFFVVIIIALR